MNPFALFTTLAICAAAVAATPISLDPNVAPGFKVCETSSECFSSSSPLAYAYMDSNWPTRSAAGITEYTDVRLLDVKKVTDNFNLTTFWKNGLGLSDADFSRWFPVWGSNGTAYVYSLKDGEEKVANCVPIDAFNATNNDRKNAYWIAASLNGTRQTRSKDSKPANQTFIWERLAASSGSSVWQLPDPPAPTPATTIDETPVSAASVLCGLVLETALLVVLGAM